MRTLTRFPLEGLAHLVLGTTIGSAYEPSRVSLIVSAAVAGEIP